MSRGNGTGYIPDKSNLKSSTRALALIQLRFFLTYHQIGGII